MQRFCLDNALLTTFTVTLLSYCLVDPNLFISFSVGTFVSDYNLLMCRLDFETPLIHHIVYNNRVKAMKKNGFLNFLICMYLGYKYPVNPPV